MVDKEKRHIENCRSTPKKAPEVSDMATQIKRTASSPVRNAEIAKKMAIDERVIEKVQTSLDPDKRKVFKWSQVVRMLRRRAS